jgi:nitrogen regulatory protein PII
MKLVRAVVREDEISDVFEALVAAGFTGAVVKIRGGNYEAVAEGRHRGGRGRRGGR